ncbi:MAG: class I SAM-dependent methyltransferase [Anaerolineae bacterium]|nr:class I SAM-dependent methyltransferase [Anaerolineae bacterium]
MERVYARIPPAARRPSRIVRLGYRLLGSALAPLTWLMAHTVSTPGLSFHPLCARLGWKMLFGPAGPLRDRRSPLEMRWLLHMVFSPMVLTRYFEFDFAWRHLPRRPVARYLDVSSPFTFPVVFMSEGGAAQADLINPDKHDLALIEQHIATCGLSGSCIAHGCLIEDAPFADASFDLITSISVIEHIPRDREAITKIWALLKPGGRLILTLPCASRGYALYTNVDHYGLLGSDEQGYTFLEYLYDEPMLSEHIYSVTGRPAHCELYGEKRDGTLRRELLRRWSGEYWRFWREPIWMGRHFRRFDSIAQLPGEGVIGLVFVKP